FACRFGCCSRGDDGTFELGIAFDVELVAIVTGNDAALFCYSSIIGFNFAFTEAGRGAIAYCDLPADILLFAVVFGGVLQAFDI
ncbi:MAG: hypothetical protein ACRCSM_02510, partial [Sediminibacterium sp.]